MGFRTMGALAEALTMRGDPNRLFAIAARQMCCGALAALVDILVFNGLLTAGILGLHGAINAGFALAFLTAYLANRYYTYRHIKRYKVKAGFRLALFLGFSLISLGLTHVLVRFMVLTLGWPPVPARAAAIGVIFFYSLFVNRKFVFSAPERQPGDLRL